MSNGMIASEVREILRMKRSHVFFAFFFVVIYEVLIDPAGAHSAHSFRVWLVMVMSW